MILELWVLWASKGISFFPNIFLLSTFFFGFPDLITDYRRIIKLEIFLLISQLFFEKKSPLEDRKRIFLPSNWIIAE